MINRLIAFDMWATAPGPRALLPAHQNHRTIQSRCNSRGFC